MKIKAGDTVRILAGKDKGKEGKVLQVFPHIGRVVVEGANLMKRHLKSGRRGTPGQVIEFPAPIHHSNLALVSPKSGMTGRIGYKVVDKEGKKTKIRVVRKAGKSEDIE